MSEAQLVRIYENKLTILEKAQQHFSNSGLGTIKIGFELEFFLRQKNLSTAFEEKFLADFIAKLKSEITQKFSLIYQVEKERGASQIEIKTTFSDNILVLCLELLKFKEFITQYLAKDSLYADFSAQPFFDDCGNALQLNISLHNLDGKNLFDGNKRLQEEMAAKLLQETNGIMIFMAPNQSDYKRFDAQLNRELFAKGKFSAPINLSFGANNRTCAIRFAKGDDGVRMEYRVAAADADPFLICAVVLLALTAFRNDEMNFEETFGNAFDEQYDLPKLVSNLDEAKAKFFNENNFVRKMLEEMVKGSSSLS